ncbi:MAG TPA: hypothetical protein VMT37_16250 [Solirubrobacterales bacterium]|nr:hypothetical protein [Solirubrobacterales bacterium]
MKNQYVGDQNDFAKYLLLRLCAQVFEEIIVAWMLTEDDGLGDGSKIGYLDLHEWREYDPVLLDGLAELVASGNRTLAAVEGSGLLPRASFFPEKVPRGADARLAYFQPIAAAAGPGSLVFFDPDNGLEVTSTPKGKRGAEKYVYLDELGPFADAGASILIYQHFPRVQRDPYVEASLSRLRAALGPKFDTFAARTSHVGFLFGVTEELASPLREALAAEHAEHPILRYIP